MAIVLCNDIDKNSQCHEEPYNLGVGLWCIKAFNYIKVRKHHFALSCNGQELLKLILNPENQDPDLNHHQRLSQFFIPHDQLPTNFH